MKNVTEIKRIIGHKENCKVYYTLLRFSYDGIEYTLSRNSHTITAYISNMMITQLPVDPLLINQAASESLNSYDGSQIAGRYATFSLHYFIENLFTDADESFSNSTVIQEDDFMIIYGNFDYASQEPFRKLFSNDLFCRLLGNKEFFKSLISERVKESQRKIDLAERTIHYAKEDINTANRILEKLNCE